MAGHAGRRIGTKTKTISGSKVAVPHGLVKAALNFGDEHQLRVYLVLRVVDSHGRGHLLRSEAVQGLMTLGLGRSAAYDWVASIAASRYASLSRRRFDGAQVLVLSSIAALLGSYGLGGSNIDVPVPVLPLLEKSYRRWLQGAARSVHNGRTMARQTIRELYGRSEGRPGKVTSYKGSPSGQRRAERDLQAVVEAQAVKHEIHRHTDVARLPAADHPSVFRSGNALIEQLPNATQFPVEPKRRRRNSSEDMAAEESTQVRPPRRYVGSRQAARRTIARLKRRASQRWDAGPRPEVYAFERKERWRGRTVRMWRREA